jgi:hypothetical protein
MICLARGTTVIRPVELCAQGIMRRGEVDPLFR